MPKLHPSRALELLFFQTWDDIWACVEAKKVLHEFAVNPGLWANLAIFGHNRTGKTRMVYFALKAKFCQARDAQGNPCHRCTQCKNFNNGRATHYGWFAELENSRYQYYTLDCHNVTADDIKHVLDSTLEDRPFILNLDEVDAPAFRPYQSRLLKAIDERELMCIATAVSFQGKTDTKTRRRKRAPVSAAFRSRFSTFVSTTVPEPEELVAGLNRLCDRFEIGRDQDALFRIAQRTSCIPGHAKRFLVHALRVNRPVTLDLVNGLDLDSD